jgi:putative radical SAM enzyme (TIGR03279 family)
LLEIAEVVPGSTAARKALRPGDSIISINNEEINDVIDFQFAAADERLTLVIRSREGHMKTLRLQKEPDDALGLGFPPLSISRCRNRCIFCFVDQMPPGCRKTLYVKDDDFRASFLYGNFITLGALSEADWQRIFRQRLSPLYISVHSTEPEVRASLLRNRNAPPILESLARLAAGGIRMHTQIVLCPGINDGDHLTRTIADLAEMFPSVMSIAVVPVGITRFRKDLYPVRTFTRREAGAVVDVLEAAALRFRKRLGTRLVFASDEFYVKAGRPVPSSSWYEDFPQIENGVGMVATFLREVSRTKLPSRLKPVTATVITGVSFSAVADRALERLRGIAGVTVRKVVVKSRFFGTTVTVTGLLTGADVVRALKGKECGDVLTIPANMLREGEPVFLDGMTIEQMEHQLGVPVAAIEGFPDLVKLLRTLGRLRA